MRKQKRVGRPSFVIRFSLFIIHYSFAPCAAHLFNIQAEPVSLFLVQKTSSFESITCPARTAPGRAISGRRPSPEVPWPYGVYDSSPVTVRSARVPQGFARTRSCCENMVRNKFRSLRMPTHAPAVSLTRRLLTAG